MAKASRSRRFGAKCRPVKLDGHFNWPRKTPSDKWWQDLAEAVRKFPSGLQKPWGIPFEMADGKGPRVILVRAGGRDVTIRLNQAADFLCLLHTWEQVPAAIRREDPTEGLVVAEYMLTYADGSTHVVPVRGRFEVAMAESPGPPFLAMHFNMWEAVDPAAPLKDWHWGGLQPGLKNTWGKPFLYALPNPHPEKRIRSLTIRGLQESPLLVAGLTLYQGTAHPLQHLPRRTYRVKVGAKPAKIEKAEVDLGGVARIEHTSGPRDKAWLTSPHIATYLPKEETKNAEDLVEVFGAPDATVSVRLADAKRPSQFSLGEAFTGGSAPARSGAGRLEVLGKTRQWMKITVIDSSTGKPTPVRIHMSGPRGEYIAPYGHHAQVNANWFEDYGADVVAGGRQYAYVHGEFTSDMPVGDVFVELYKGFEYQPIRKKVSIRPGQKELKLSIDRWQNLREAGWVTADTHVHFVSPQTAWLEAQCEGVNVVNLLASQWGRLFTNVGDLSGRVGIVENDTIVYVGTENRNHMLGHMSMLGTKGLPVFPMCCGGPSESFVGDPDFMALAEWALENKRKGGVVIRPHFPYCGFTEDPVPILAGLVDALEVRDLRGEDFPTQEWYRYLNCGYRVAVAGGTDKMGAYCPLGWLRTYAQLDPDRRFTYDAWAKAVRAGRTFATNGPIINLRVEGRPIGDTISLRSDGGTLHAVAGATSFWPLGKIEIVHNGRVVAAEHARRGARMLTAEAAIKAKSSGWIAARCSGLPGHPAGYMAAHTSPIYIQCGESRLFDAPAAEHMLALVEGGIEYLNTLSTAFDEPSRRRMVRLYKEAQRELNERLLAAGASTHHYIEGHYHTHGHAP